MRMIVTARGLTRIACRLGPIECRNVALFPFFGSEGGARGLMILPPTGSEVYWMPIEGGSVYVRWMAPVFRADTAPIPVVVGPEELAEMARWWHYDPWWMLDQPRYQGLDGAEILKGTNAAPLLRKQHIRSIIYARDLSRIRWVVARPPGESAEWRRWSTGRLPSRANTGSKSTPAKARSSGGVRRWRLAPMWQERT